MTIPVTCECGKKLRAKQELAGRRVKCPACGEVLVVPDPASGVDSPPEGPLDLNSLAAAETSRSSLPRAPLPQVARQADKSNTPIIIGASAAVGGLVVVLLLVLILWPSGDGDEQTIGGQDAAGNGPPGGVATSSDNSVTVAGESTPSWPTVADAARTYPSFPDAATEPPPWIGERAPFDVAKFFETPPAEENAAPLYLDAFFEFSRDVSICFLPSGQEPQGETLRRCEVAQKRGKEFSRLAQAWEKDPESVDEAAVDAWLAQYETGFQKLAHAQKRPQCVFETGVGVAALLPHTQARQIARIAKWRVSRDLARGNIDRPIEDVLLVLRLSRDLQPRGHVICQLVSAAMDNLCCEEIITQILRADGLGQEHCDRLIGELTQHEVASQRRMTEGVRMEYLIARKTFHDFQHHTGDFSPQAMKDMGQPDSPLTCLKVLIDFSFSGQLVKEKYGKGAAGLTPAHPLVAFAAGWKHDGKLLSDADYANEVNALNTVYASILSNADRTLLEQVRASADPAIVEPLRATKVALFFEPTGGQNWQKAFLKTETTLRGTQCLIAMKRWQLDHDGPPPDLDTIVKAAGMKAVPLDPYTNQPMRTTTFMGRPVVYSIGPDGKDDRGQEAKWDSKSTNWQGDFPFRLNATR
jgi:hypothetical protein